MAIDRFSVQRQPIVGLEREIEELEAQAVPLEEVDGSLPERIMYRDLLQRRALFFFRYWLVAAPGVAGALQVDFYFTDRPLIIEIYGVYFHEAGRLRDVEREERIKELEPEKRLATIWDTEVYNREFREDWLRRNVDAALMGAPVALEEEPEWLT